MNQPHSLTGNGLKWVAIVTMFLDHVGATLALSLFYVVRTRWMLYFYYALRGVGRLAFPIFCFLLSEGFAHTRSKGKYALRLGLFALISDIPFDMAFFAQKGQFIVWEHQNVFFTLLLGLLGLWLWEALAKRLPQTLQYPAALAALVPCYWAAERLCTDYGGFGVALIMGIGVAAGLPASQRAQMPHREAQVLAGAAIIVLYCWLENNWLEMWGAFGLLPVLYYNGERGRGNKWFFYLFYPLHLLLLSLLNWALF